MRGGESNVLIEWIKSDRRLNLCDEPTGALDAKTSAEVMDILNQINVEGKTIIVVTHDLNIAERCNRKIIIADGEINEWFFVELPKIKQMLEEVIPMF